MATPPPLRIQLRKVDREEFTAYPWGEIQDGEIVKRYPEGEERFGPFDEIVTRSQELMPPDADPANPLPWLDLWHNYGSQAHYPRADVVHPELDRHLWGTGDFSAVGALQGLQHPKSSFSSIHVLQRAGEHVQTTGAPLEVRYQLGESARSVDLSSEKSIEKEIHPTIRNVLRFASDATVYGKGGFGPAVDRFIITAVGWNRVLCHIEITSQSTKDIAWEAQDCIQLKDASAMYYDTSEGWHQDVSDRYEAYANAISDANDFPSLLGAIARHGPIQGSSHEYSVSELSSIISELQTAAKENTPVEYINFRRLTRTLGLREKCHSLYVKQKA